MKFSHPKDTNKSLCTIVRTDDRKPLGLIVQIAWAVAHEVVTPDDGWEQEAGEYLLIDADTQYITHHRTYEIARAFATLRYTTD